MAMNDTLSGESRPRPDAAQRMRWLVLGLVALGTAIGWIWLAAGIAALLATSDMAALGPGMALFNRLNGLADLPESVRAGIALLCSPTASQPWSLGELGLSLTMWLCMVLAMMLPSATPMLLRVGATGQGAGAVLALIAGYLAIWSGFALVATLAGAALAAARLTAPAMGPMTGVLASTTLAAAALYQLTPLKAACLERCRVPPVAFLPVSAGPADLFRLGLAEGRACLGCCWALMAVMFAAGVMNVVWIALLGAAMVAEKLGRGPWPSRLIALALLAIAAAWLAASPIGARLLAGF